MNLGLPDALLPLAAALSDFPSASDSIIYQLTGLAVVFTALGSIWSLLELMALWFKWRARRAKASVVPVATATAPVATMASSDAPAPQLPATMAAAAHPT